jgi:hypothetical protein
MTAMHVVGQPFSAASNAFLAAVIAFMQAGTPA